MKAIGVDALLVAVMAVSTCVLVQLRVTVSFWERLGAAAISEVLKGVSPSLKRDVDLTAVALFEQPEGSRRR